MCREINFNMFEVTENCISERPDRQTDRQTHFPCISRTHIHYKLQELEPWKNNTKVLPWKLSHKISTGALITAAFSSPGANGEFTIGDQKPGLELQKWHKWSEYILLHLRLGWTEKRTYSLRTFWSSSCWIEVQNKALWAVTKECFKKLRAFVNCTGKPSK